MVWGEKGHKQPNIGAESQGEQKDFNWLFGWQKVKLTVHCGDMFQIIIAVLNFIYI